MTWEQMNGYKFEFVDATPVTDEIKLELAFDGVTSFKVNDEDVEFANGATIEYSKKYEIQGVATDAQFAAGDIYHLNYKLFDAEGNELNRLNYGEFLTFSYGYYNDYQIETAGQIPFDIGFEMASHCKVAQGENGNLVKIAKIVFSLAK